MNQKLISKAFSGIDLSLVAEGLTVPEAADRTSERTIQVSKYAVKHRVNTRRLMRLVLAACLIFALSATAYAVHYFLGIRDMDKKLPEKAEPYIQQHTEAAVLEDWSAQITESLCDETQILVTVTVSGGDRYIIAPTYADPNTLVADIGIEGDLTLGEYAEEQGKKLLFVGASLKENESLGGIGSQDFRNTSPNEMTILIQSNKTAALTENEIICRVYAVDETWEKQTMDIPFTFEQAPSVGTGAFVPDKPDAVPGMIVGNATVTETPMGISIRFMQTVTDDAVWDNLKKVEFDGIVRGEGGWVLEDDGNWWFTVSRCAGSVGDTLTAHYYDWDDNIVGTIVFTKN